MSFKDLGAFWRKTDRNGDAYYSGTLNVVALVNAGPEARITVRRNKDKRNPKQPDVKLSLVVSDEKPRGPVEEYERAHPDPYGDPTVEDDGGLPF